LVARRWTPWRGRAVRPVVREALSLAAADLPWPGATVVRGWWNRAFDPEIGLIGADREPVAGRLWYAGSVKWADDPFDGQDLAALRRGVTQVPGYDPAETVLVGVSCGGFADAAAASLALRWVPKDIVGAFT
jgi:hypothetical protein